MKLWMEWWSVIEPLREACSREASFLWLATATAGMCARGDLMGVTSIVRTLGLFERCYDRLLDFFHSSAVCPDRLSRKWASTALRIFPETYRFEGKPVLLGDGIKVPKSGRKMPAVKLLHQVSDSNTKPEYIMGHSIQVVSLLVQAAGTFFAVPLTGRIHEGVKFTNRDHRRLPGKFCSLIGALEIGEPFYLVADAYYACGPVVLWLVGIGCHLVSRMRKSVVAYEAVPEPKGQRGRGRPRLYGKRIKLWKLFDQEDLAWSEVESPVYDDKEIMIRYLCLDLLWRPVRRVVRFVLVDHPTRGRCIFFGTDTAMSPVDLIRLYGLRFKIELSFKQALRVIGVYAYHFWSRVMKKLPRRSGDQHLHRATDAYRAAIRRKLAAYHRHIQIGLIAQGALQYLAVKHSKLVWSGFGSWLRTIRPGIAPSEFVVAAALRNSLPDFLADSTSSTLLKKFIREKIDVSRSEGLRLTG